MEKRQNDLMITGSIWKKILLFSAPLMLGNLLQQLYSTIDSIIVGHAVGSIALAAVGASTMVIYLLIAFSQGAAVGAGVIVAQYLGAGEKERTQEAVHTALAIAVILGVLLTAGGIAGTETLLRWMDTPEEVLPEAALYLEIYSGGLLFNVLYNMAAGILNAAGNSRAPLFYLGIAGIVHVALALIGIGWLGMGVAGAAFATDAGQALSAALCLASLARKQTDYQVHFQRIALHPAMARRILQVAIPVGVQNMVIGISNVIVQAAVNGYGAAVVAGFGVYLRIDGLIVLPILAIGMAATTFIGQNYGAGKRRRMEKGLAVTLSMGTIYAAAAGAAVLLFSDTVIGAFTNDPAVIAESERAMWYFCPFYIVMTLLNILGGAVRGVGRSVPPMIVMLFSFCVFRMFWVWLAPPFFPGAEGIYLVYPVSWTIGLLMMAWYSRYRGWRNLRGIGNSVS